jgi:sigma-54 dependent transcriptional regulator, flagellar regulatory protein
LDVTARKSAALENLIIGESAAIDQLRRLIRQVAPSQASVLITGPSGSGKEVVARAIHAESARGGQAYVPVNCGAIPRELLESELFGHEKGSFTGAHAQHRGRFEEADGGSLFLDEIGDMPADMQVKLLRVLEERCVQRIGGRGQIPVDVRIVAATHRDIDAAIDDGRFREDLFYRLAVFPIAIPSLAERAEDIPLLVRHFVAKAAPGSALTFSSAALDRLMAHRWPGNVRELRNLVERAAILFAGQNVGPEQVDAIMLRRGRVGAAERLALWEATDRIAAENLSGQPSAPPVEETSDCPFPATAGRVLAKDRPLDLRSVVADIEQHYIQEALQLAGGIVADAARLLSLQRTTLIEKMRKYELAPSR